MLGLKFTGPEPARFSKPKGFESSDANLEHSDMENVRGGGNDLQGRKQNLRNMSIPEKYITDLHDLEKRGEKYFRPGEKVAFTGHYFWKYENGVIAEEGYLRDGIVSGRIKLYGETGTLLVEAEYRRGVRHGQVTTYYGSGNIKSAFNLKDGKRHGRFLMWYERGGKKFEASYEEDLLHGKQVKYFSNGIRSFETFFREGREHGRKTIWNERGDILFTGDFREGELI